MPGRENAWSAPARRVIRRWFSDAVKHYPVFTVSPSEAAQYAETLAKKDSKWRITSPSKCLSGELAADGTIGELANEAAAFANQVEDCREEHRGGLSGAGQAPADYSRLSRR
jgi:hypothetical protein